MKRYIYGLIIIFFILGLFLPIHRLMIIDQKNGKIIKSFPVKNGEKFTVCFTHSVERTPWYEIYYIENNNEIFLKETIFFSYGAGLPATTEYKFSLGKEGMNITNYNQKIEPLIYRVGAVIADHRLMIKNKEIHLNEITKPFNPVLIQAKKMSIYEYLIKEVKK